MLPQGPRVAALHGTRKGSKALVPASMLQWLQRLNKRAGCSSIALMTWQLSMVVPFKILCVRQLSCTHLKMECIRPGYLGRCPKPARACRKWLSTFWAWRIEAEAASSLGPQLHHLSAVMCHQPADETAAVALRVCANYRLASPEGLTHISRTEKAYVPKCIGI